MKQERIISIIVSIFMGWSIFRPFLSIFVGIEEPRFFFTALLGMLIAILYQRGYGVSYIINKNNAAPFFVWTIFACIFFYHTNIEYPSFIEEFNLPRIRGLIEMTLKFSLVGFILGKHIIDADKFLYNLMIVLTICCVSIFLYMLYTEGFAFLVIEAVVYGGGVTLISLSYSLVLVGVICLYILSRKDIYHNRTFPIICMVVISILVLLMGKRGALLSLAFPALVIYLFANKTIKQSMIYILTILVLYVIVINNVDMFFDFLGLFSERLAEKSAAAYYLGETNNRDVLWELAIDQFNKNPIWGYYPFLINADSSSSWCYGLHPHNYWLQSLMGVGLVGSIPFFCYILFLLAKKTYSAIINKTIYRFWAILLISEIIHGTFSSNITSSVIWIVIFAMCYYKSNDNIDYERAIEQ